MHKCIDTLFYYSYNLNRNHYDLTHINSCFHIIESQELRNEEVIQIFTSMAYRSVRFIRLYDGGNSGF